MRPQKAINIMVNVVQHPIMNRTKKYEHSFPIAPLGDEFTSSLILEVHIGLGERISLGNSASSLLALPFSVLPDKWKGF